MVDPSPKLAEEFRSMQLPSSVGQSEFATPGDLQAQSPVQVSRATFQHDGVHLFYSNH
ncbi:MAG: hypothetical protein AAGJ87_09865 [Pseudomonadota bacterium]